MPTPCGSGRAERVSPPPPAIAVYCRLPFYSLAKLFLLYALWAPSFKVASSIYTKALGPILASHEADIDKMVVEYRTKASDMFGQQAEA